MSHDASKVLMGSTVQSDRTVTNHAGSVEAGVACRQKSDGTLSQTLADGGLLGVSLGKDLSNISRTAICRRGLAVPILLTAAFTPTVGAFVSISDTTGKAIAAGAGATVTKARYKTGALTAVKEDGTEVATGAALIDMEGGL